MHNRFLQGEQHWTGMLCPKGQLQTSKKPLPGHCGRSPPTSEIAHLLQGRSSVLAPCSVCHSPPKPTLVIGTSQRRDINIPREIIALATKTSRPHTCPITTWVTSAVWRLFILNTRHTEASWGDQFFSPISPAQGCIHTPASVKNNKLVHPCTITWVEQLYLWSLPWPAHPPRDGTEHWWVWGKWRHPSLKWQNHPQLGWEKSSVERADNPCARVGWQLGGERDQWIVLGYTVVLNAP